MQYLKFPTTLKTRSISIIFAVIIITGIIARIDAITGLFVFFGIVIFGLILIVLYDRKQIKTYDDQMKGLQEKLLAAEQNNYLMNNANDAILLIETNGKIINANEKASKMYGYTKEEFRKLFIIDLRADFTRSIIKEQMEEVLKKGGLIFETIHLRKEGSQIPVEVSTRVVEFRNIKCYQSIIRDITERVETEKKLKDILKQLTETQQILIESQRDLKHAQLVAHIGSWRLNVQGNELFWSDEAYRIFGIPLNEQMNYEKFLAKVHPADMEYVNMKWNAALRGEKYDIEHRIIVDGKIKWVNEKVELEFDSKNKLLGGFGTVQDITELKQVQQELIESEERVRKKLESILSYEMDINGMELSDIIDIEAIQLLMKNFYELTRIPMSIIDLRGRVLVGVGWQDVCMKFHRVHPKTSMNCIESDSQLSSGIFPGEFREYRCKNNMRDIVTPIIIGGQHLGNIFTGQFFYEGEPLDYEYFRDQARRYNFNEKEYINALESVPRIRKDLIQSSLRFFINLANILSQMGYRNLQLVRSLADKDSLVEELRRSNKDLEQFAYVASHDLQEPTRTIKIYSQLLLKKCSDKLDGNTNEYLNFLTRGADRIHHLIDGLLQYSRLNSRSKDFEDINCSEIINSILKDIEQLVKKENALINYGELPVIFGDKTQIRQLFQNLILNAIKFRSESTPEININCEKMRNNWLFSVKDNGIGIEPQYFSKIFLIFQRLNDNEKYEGHGLGLAICSKIVERHGGNISVDSTPGRGSTFYFTIPEKNCC